MIKKRRVSNYIFSKACYNTTFLSEILFPASFLSHFLGCKMTLTSFNKGQRNHVTSLKGLIFLKGAISLKSIISLKGRFIKERLSSFFSFCDFPFKVCGAFVFLLLFSFPCFASNPPENFKASLKKLEQEARAHGISERVIQETLAHVVYTPHVVKRENTQVVYFNFPLYFDNFANPKRVLEGRRKLWENRRILNKISRKYNVSKYILVTLWGMETHYGSIKGHYNIVNALATLSLEERRGRFFKNELFAALKIIQSGERTPRNFLSGWAGASGHFQFMPTTYQAYAVDFDHNGKKNIWEDKKDAIASAANYLKKLGWRNNETWGTVVTIPDKLCDIRYLGFKHARSLREWKKLGVKLHHYAPFMRHQKASLLLPVGHHGPAFLVFHNFNIIYRWNRSINYSLTANLIADMLKNPKRPYRFHFSRKLVSLTTNDIRSIQSGLKKIHLLKGRVDGQMGNATRHAIAAFQRSHHMLPDGYPDKTFIKIFKQNILLS